MEIMQKIVRVYGINDKNDTFNPYFKNCLNKPILIENYPKHRMNVEISILDSIDPLISLDNTGRAVSKAFMLHGVKYDKPDFDDLVRKEIPSIRSKIPKCKYYIKLMFETPETIGDKYILDREFYWIDYCEALKLKKNLPFASKCLDIFSTHLSLEIGTYHFSNLLINDWILFSMNDNQDIKFCELILKGGKAVGFTGNLIHSDLEKSLLTVGSKPFKKHNWLYPSSHFYMSSLHEKDPWKQFFWLSNALELLTENAFKILFEETIKKLYFKLDDDSYLNYSDMPIKILKEKKELNLVDRFEIVAFQLNSVSDAKIDIEKFNKIKGFRDSMAHGRPIKIEDLPITDCNNLLKKYIANFNSYLDVE